MSEPSSSGSSPYKVRHQAEDLASLFPALLVEAEKLAQSIITGIHGRRQAGSGETFWQHRPYAFGDAVSNIDWRQSARSTDRLYIRQNEWEAAASIWLWRDPSASMRYSSEAKLPEKRHRATVLMISLAILLSQAGERIGVLSPREEGARLFHGRSTPGKILENLDHGTAEDHRLIPSGEHLRQGAHVVLASDFFMAPEEIARAVDQCTSRGATGILLQVLDPAEQQFPFRGRTEFLDTETSSSLLFGNAGSLRSSYREKFAEHQHYLQEISRKSGWPLKTHYTNAKPREALLFLFSMLGEKRSISPAAAGSR